VHKLSLRIAAAAAAAGVVLAAVPASALPPGPADIVTQFAGTGSSGVSTPGPAQSNPVGSLRQMAVDAAGNIYAADWTNGRILKVTPSGELSIVAGTGAPTSTPLTEPEGLAVDRAGNLYVADNSKTIMKITPAGQLSVIAGDGSSGSTVAGGALATSFDSPYGLAVDAAGNVYVADNSNDVVAKITPAGQLSIVAGGGGTSGPFPGSVPATDLSLDPLGLAVDSMGNVYVGDYSACYVAKVTPSGTATVFAGKPGGGSCAAPTPGPATDSDLNELYHLSTDAHDNLYIGDYYSRLFEKVTPAGVLSVYGTGLAGPPNYTNPIATSPLGRGYSAVANAAGVLFFDDNDNYSIDRIGPPTPSAPRDLHVTPGDGMLSLSFLPPYDPGTAAITGYEVSLDNGATWQPLSTTTVAGRLTATLPNLTNGTQYPVLVQARNTNGASGTTNPAAGTPGVPSTPSGAPGLPVTGVNAAAIASVGLLLVLLGFRLAAVRRRAH
jgi:hypothetical protein